jgi:adenylosuccinate lyase
MTSSDVLDTALSIQMKQAGELLLTKLDAVLEALKKQAVKYKDTVMVGRSHGVHAEPITFGFKLAVWYGEMLRNRERLLAAIDTISVGKISGAVGTFAHMEPFIEEYVCEKLGLKPAPISTQVVQRDRHAAYLSELTIIAATIEKIALEIRHLQRTEVLEVEEPFGSKQKGSSAMPHKKNPIISERLCGMARLLRGNLVAALENVALWHERDISHSSVERVIMPDSTITLYYMLEKTRHLLEGMVVNEDNMLKNLNASRGMVFSQTVLLALVKKGITREQAYRMVQRNALNVYHNETTLKDELLKDPEIKSYFTEAELEELFNIKNRLKNIDIPFKRLGLID